MAGILLLEDEESVNRGIEFTLKKEGYEIYSVSTIQEARQIFEEKELDLMICDVNLPDGSSLDFIREVRKTSMVHIICLTAMDTEMDQVMGYESGADDYITKPFSLSVLVLKVNAYFKKYQKASTDVIESGGILFLMPEMKARKGEEELTFTKNEWKMLRAFLEHPKQILSKNQILERLFDVDGEFVDENTVAVNIRRLREKIEDDAGKPEFIRNIRGLGYIWDKECRKGQGA
nr:response regulator transcription factor [uncultured Sellimonas sp.]